MPKHKWSIWADTNDADFPHGDFVFEGDDGGNAAVIALLNRHYGKSQIEDFSDEIHVYDTDADWGDDDLEPIAGATYEGEVE
jgi:hypothetical protein